METPVFFYVLFPNHHEGLRLFNALKEAGARCTITPTPRFASHNCGISLRIPVDLLDITRQVAARNGSQIDAIVYDTGERHPDYS